MNPSYKPLTRSTTARMFAGVCGGLAEYSNIDPTIIRLAAVLLFFVTGPAVIVAYLIMALIMPEQQAVQPPQ